MNQVLATVDGVQITERQARIYARRFNIDYVPSNVPGIVGSLTAWVDKTMNEQADAFLLESPETRDEFKAIREAHEDRAGGVRKTEEEMSKVMIEEVIPDWKTFVGTLPTDEQEQEQEQTDGEEQASA